MAKVQRTLAHGSIVWHTMRACETRNGLLSQVKISESHSSTESQLVDLSASRHSKPVAPPTYGHSNRKSIRPTLRPLWDESSQRHLQTNQWLDRGQEIGEAPPTRNYTKRRH